jgi:hypothetical protein
MTLKSALLLVALSAASSLSPSRAASVPLRATVKVGEEVKVTVNAEGDAPTFCGRRRLATTTRQIKIATGESQFPVTAAKTYGKAGSTGAGKKVTTHFPCNGKAEVRVMVEAGAAAGAVCPEGYKPQGKAGKAGDFNCKAGKGAKAPEKAMTCGAGLEYFQSKAALGCRKAK